MATEVQSSSSMPQLQSVQKAMSIPTVGAAVGQVGALYYRVKEAHSLLEWALSTAEASVSMAAHTAAPFVAAPLAAGDAKIAAALDHLEKRVPLVSQQPKVIMETTKQAVLSRLSPTVNKVCAVRAKTEQRVKSLKDLSWAKANVLLSTAYGQKAVGTVDTGAVYAMQLLDYYLPPTTPQEEAASAELVAATSDPALHTVQTVGRLSAVAARRVWGALARRLQDFRENGGEKDVKRYVTALLAALHLASVTNQQHQDEAAKEAQATAQSQPKDHENAPAAAEKQVLASKVASSAPTTTEIAKTTPEAKSKKQPKSKDS